MRIMLSGFEQELCIQPGSPLVLEVLDKTLFARMCQSVFSGLGESALEPYLAWDEKGKPMRPDKVFLPVYNPFDLPWSHKLLLGKALDRMVDLMIEDENARLEVESASRRLSEMAVALGLQLQSDYVFDIEWSLKEHLKAFDFEVQTDAQDSLLDSLSKFLRLAEDARLNRVLCFANLKSFLTDRDLCSVYEQIFSSKLTVLLLEGSRVEKSYAHERKMLIDQDLLQITE